MKKTRHFSSSSCGFLLSFLSAHTCRRGRVKKLSAIRLKFRHWKQNVSCLHNIIFSSAHKNFSSCHVRARGRIFGISSNSLTPVGYGGDDGEEKETFFPSLICAFSLRHDAFVVVSVVFVIIILISNLIKADFHRMDVLCRSSFSLWKS